ncbi:MAG: GNAT family N-acetyltransferase [Thermoflexales bacterium]|nr:GNAT family N-acetyltransferase [Thermoflexales bacterium]MCX7939759.1 GNAT family N-acetyltransferase [Thermoflexales bacterium]MDW8053538.1 GNAT family N-acetyltransferase [Anaerolineae bacterium]MDW8292166.1 GNAT family N-acetyltransferase [Anaerolineae bacterium]
MIARANRPALALHPHVRPFNPWRDSVALADLLESAFSESELDESSHRLIQRLRYYGAFDLLAFGQGAGFVWVEHGELLGNASVQRNPTRGDTWIIGNVATRADARNRGIGRAVVEACIQYAAQKGARYVALQADVTNAPAIHLYDKLGFERLVEVVHYLRPPVRAGAFDASSALAHTRPARWSDRSTVLALAQHCIPEASTYAEAFDSNVYRLGPRWSLVNALSGNVEAWHIAKDGNGAVRTRVNYEGSCHHIELLLDAEADEEIARALLMRGLHRFTTFLSKPIYAAQIAPTSVVHQAFLASGFRVLRTLAHMRLTL